MSMVVIVIQLSYFVIIVIIIFVNRLFQLDGRWLDGWLFGILRAGNIKGHIRMGTDL